MLLLLALLHGSEMFVLGVQPVRDQESNMLRSINRAHVADSEEWCGVWKMLALPHDSQNMMVRIIMIMVGDDSDGDSLHHACPWVLQCVKWILHCWKYEEVNFFKQNGFFYSINLNILFTLKISLYYSKHCRFTPMQKTIKASEHNYLPYLCSRDFGLTQTLWEPWWLSSWSLSGRWWGLR